MSFACRRARGQYRTQMIQPNLPLAMQWAAHLARDRRRSAHTVRAYRATA